MPKVTLQRKKRASGPPKTKKRDKRKKGFGRNGIQEVQESHASARLPDPAVSDSDDDEPHNPWIPQRVGRGPDPDGNELPSRRPGVPIDASASGEVNVGASTSGEVNVGASTSGQVNVGASTSGQVNVGASTSGQSTSLSRGFEELSESEGKSKVCHFHVNGMSHECHDKSKTSQLSVTHMSMSCH